MYISNVENIANTISFSIPVGKYLETHGFPVINKKNNRFIFSNTEALKKMVLKLPFYLKPLCKGGG